MLTRRLGRQVLILCRTNSLSNKLMSLKDIEMGGLPANPICLVTYELSLLVAKRVSC